MAKRKWCLLTVFALLAIAVCLHESSFAEEAKENPRAWQEQAVEYARILSRVKWTPVAGGMPNRRGGYFEEGTEYTGVPYSSVKSVGRCIGFDIYLKTFLAAVENPQSVLYTENLSGKVSNAATYYGKVCSTFTSYALQCAFRTGARITARSFATVSFSSIRNRLSPPNRAMSSIRRLRRSVGVLTWKS